MAARRANPVGHKHPWLFFGAHGLFVIAFN
jgi:hypothetical protein